ncbi:lytic polysaccharide monooxygenase auxiliary activity family 9 protein [Streptomyces litchfieldiae]|uniref:Lytic polysaccharide monooxygenase n=1 Tax=Streptomyces litchfieldiae TaxID=3075543 RepID=A0ABU2MR77_9ACTN|nr:lytic polysaccharide monooxygenase [Streptomyces sp. DSM 44938]MDT0344137.1 lytic polysaccharide monooxygenase [Streptomyces sp. DSM 44938]
MSDRVKARARLRKFGMLTAMASLPAMAAVMFTGGSAAAHGAPMDPGSRTYLCWKYSMDSTGAMNPTNPACRAALETSGANGFYNWFAVLQSNGGGRTEGFIPDGELCSGAATVYDFSGFDLPRTDWPYTHLTAGATYEFTYNPWAHHPGTFHQYVTVDGWDPTQPLTWDDIEDVPFHSETDPPYRGSVGNADSEYYWNAQLPEGKEGRHIIYTVWERSDSEETFYGCSDVVFDGGNGEVTVPGVSDADAAESAAAAERLGEEAAPLVSEEHSSGEHAEHAAHTAEGTASPMISALVRAMNGVLPGWAD